MEKEDFEGGRKLWLKKKKEVTWKRSLTKLKKLQWGTHFIFGTKTVRLHNTGSRLFSTPSRLGIHLEPRCNSHGQIIHFHTLLKMSQNKPNSYKLAPNCFLLSNQSEACQFGLSPFPCHNQNCASTGSLPSQQTQACTWPYDLWTLNIRPVKQ